MLELTAERAQVGDGQHILELGCGWRSLTPYLAIIDIGWGAFSCGVASWIAAVLTRPS